MSGSKLGRIARYFFGTSAHDDIVDGAASRHTASFPDNTSYPGESFSHTAPTGSRDEFPEILRTGSMLSLGADLLEDVPRRLGPYRILERIGEGGMGVVYLAEQDPPLVRFVAIKLARTAVSGDRALARFESERQTLAAMNHPNIARVFDAGSAPDSRPYFVMEHVAGESITEFCDARRIGIEKRLELFVGVCDGVQHAHLNAVIHRDLKPSNILVTNDAGRPTPKIIDFGVAKALDAGPRPAGDITQFGQLVGTPEYMSPEQAALDGRPVDTRTDVYSLGVVLYELLAGVRPFERDTDPDASFVDLCRRIREEAPERPSTRVARTSDVEAARRSGYVPQTLARQLRGDLDAIAIKALAKDPADRYGTPSDMAADVERFLQHRPIVARTPGSIDRFRKVVRRHRRASVVIVVLSATIVGFAVLGTVQALSAQRASARAQAEAEVSTQVRRFLEHVINPPVQWNSGEWPVDISDTPTREAILTQIRERFANLPELQSQLLLAAGQHQSWIHGLGTEADMLTASRDRIVSLRGPDSPQALAATQELARSYTVQFPQKAESLLLDVLERRRRLFRADHPDTWRTTAQLAEVYRALHKDDQAAPLLEASNEWLERQLGPDHRDVLLGKLSLSGSYLELGRYSETQMLLEPQLERIRRVLGERDFQTQVGFYNLACATANLGDVEDALCYLRESIDRGWNYPISLDRDPLLLPLRGDPRFDELERAGRLNERAVWELRCFEAEMRVREGRLTDAERLLHGLIAAIERVDRKGAGGKAVIPRLTLAKCWILRGRFDDAEHLLLPTLSEVQASMQMGDERRTIGSMQIGDERRTLDLLAQCDIGRGRRQSALDRIEAAIALVGPLRPFENVERYYHEAQSAALRGRDDEALRSLAHASEMGFDDAEHLEHDLAFRRLRARAEFAAIAKAARRRAF